MKIKLIKIIKKLKHLDRNIPSVTQSVSDHYAYVSSPSGRKRSISAGRIKNERMEIEIID